MAMLRVSTPFQAANLFVALLSGEDEDRHRRHRRQSQVAGPSHEASGIKHGWLETPLSMKVLVGK